MIIFSCIHVAANGVISFFYGWVVFHCVDIPHLHSSVDGYLGCFHVLAIVNSADVDIGVHVICSVMVFCKYMSRNGVARSYNSSIFLFLRNLHTVLHSGCTNLHSHQQCGRISFPQIFSCIYCVYIFLMMTILTCVRWNLIVVLICISLITSSVEHLSCVSWSSVCLLWRNVYLDLLSFFNFFFWAI